MGFFFFVAIICHLKRSQPSNEDICFHMVLDTYHQKFHVILSKLVCRWRTPSDSLIGSDKSLTALEVKRAHDKGQAEAVTLPAKTAHAVSPNPQTPPPPPTPNTKLIGYELQPPQPSKKTTMPSTTSPHQPTQTITEFRHLPQPPCCLSPPTLTSTIAMLATL